ncbi:MAG TPA: AMP-binding protein [Novosphingobium sp.]
MAELCVSQTSQKQVFTGHSETPSSEARFARLLAEDAQFRAARPIAAVTAAKMAPGIRLGEIAEILMQGYADRPALGQRRREVVVDPASGRRTSRLLPAFETITYRELWARAQAIASDWRHAGETPIAAGDFACVLGFASPDYAAVQLACIHASIVVVPLQTSAPVAQNAAIIAETEPRVLAASVTYLDAAVDAVLAGTWPQRLDVFDVEPGNYDHLDALKAARARLAEAGCACLVETFDAVIARGRASPPVVLHVPAADEDPLATGLLRLGLVKGDRLGIWSPSRWEWVVTQFATARIGVILVNINPAYRVAEVAYALNKVGCRALICASRFKTSDYIAMLREVGRERLPGLEFLVSLGDEPVDGFLSFASLLTEMDSAAVAAIEATLDPADAINIQFTSGTTGSPKGATLSHCNILNNGYFVGARIGLTTEDRLCIPVPLYHCFGMVMGNLACLNHGAAMIYPGEGFDPLAVLRTVEDERCTALYGVPTMFIQILNHAEFARFDLSSLRTGIMAGAPCPEVVMNDVIERMHMREVTIAYGMTETSPVSLQTGRDDPVAERVTTVGQVQPHLEVKIVDTDGATVPLGTPGEICTRGYSVMLGYWDDPERTAEAIDGEGWMHTGDLGTLDAAGYARVTGRIKDMLIRGGENIYPREIEEFLLRHPAVADVQVVGVPDARFGEAVCACVLVKPRASLDKEAVRAFCRGQIAHYKIPEHVLFPEELPMTVTGKVQKFRLREWAARRIVGETVG